MDRELVAIECLDQISGPHHFKEKCEALGYECKLDEATARIVENTETVALVTDFKVSIQSNLSHSVAQRIVTDTQWQSLMKLDRWRVAVHEAGHTVFAFQSGFGVDHVYMSDFDNAAETCLPPIERRRLERLPHLPSAI